LIKAARSFPGGLITVTHNRDFLKRCSKHFLSIVPGAFLEFETMKDAERATYSFITALEQGKEIDVKKAIQENRGGGAIHTEEYLAQSAARLNDQQALAKAEADAIAAEAQRVADELAEKVARKAAKLAAQKTDWVAGDKCFAPVKGKFVAVEVVRNVPAMGVTVKLESGKTMMFEAKKLQVVAPDAAAEVPAAGDKPAPASANRGRGGARGASGPARGARGGRGRGK
jgi:ATPase subunit of ABC transporter with duplicated ATPase domains